LERREAQAEVCFLNKGEKMTEQVHQQMSVSYLHDRGPYPGVLGWIFSLDHKRIGLLYLTALCTFFGVGATLGVLMRLELLTPYHHMVGPQTYNAFFTLHGITMIFLFLIPSIPASLGNFFIPLQIGAREVFFPRLNLLSWWLYMFGALGLVLAMFSGGKAPDTGWTFYTPYSTTTQTMVTLATGAIFVIGFSTILTGINFITTIHRMRAPGMTWFRMPLFVWAIYSTAWIQVLATPVIGITFVLLILDRLFHLGLFDPAQGGDPILYQHLFWIYSHPAVYIMILPAMGIVSEIITVFSRKNVFGYKFIAYSSVAIALVGSLVWGHHMFVSGSSDWSNYAFSFLTFIVAVPSAIKVFNWVATLYRGSITMSSPFLLTMFFLFLFLIGGLTGLIQGALGANLYLHDTYWVGIMFFAGLHYWFPKMFGKMYRERPAIVAIVTIFIGFNLLYFSMLLVGLQGMPRRYYTYLPRFQPLNISATVGSWIMISGFIILAVNLLYALRYGAKAPPNPWGAATLEWQTSSPPPTENFAEIPRVDAGPYEFED
jgi:cytochrome c oxidase subunit 1